MLETRLSIKLLSFFLSEYPFTGPQTDACDLCGPEESEQRRLPSKVVHPQYASRTRAGHASRE